MLDATEWEEIMALTVTLAFTAGVMGDLPPGVSGGFDPPSAFELCNIDTGRSASNVCPLQHALLPSSRSRVGRAGLDPSTPNYHPPTPPTLPPLSPSFSLWIQHQLDGPLHSVLWLANPPLPSSRSAPDDCWSLAEVG